MSTRGALVINLFTSLDGVAQAPSSRDEDPSDNFAYGGWQATFPDSMVAERVRGYVDSMDALLLGRRTYDIFAAYWPHHDDNVIGKTFNRVPKYVATQSHLEPIWSHSTVLGRDIVGDVDALRDEHRQIHVVGSLALVRTLIATGTFDELCLWVHPVILGSGRRIFPEDHVPATLRLLEPPLTGDQQVVQLRYAPAGPLVLGSADA